MPEQNFVSHSSEKCFSKRSDQQSTKEVMVVALGNRADAVNHYKKSEHKRKKDIEALKKHNKIIFRIVKSSVSRCELNMINKIRAKAYNNCSYSSSDSSSNDSDYIYYLFSVSYW